MDLVTVVSETLDNTRHVALVDILSAIPVIIGIVSR